ncbi:MAG: transporter [Actinomycetia bacterium]|nr:transporter [Actinomycetes bacterium]
MYPSLRPAAVLGAEDGPPTEDSPTGEDPPRSGPPVSANVVFLGLTSLFTDISSEMVTAILPLYLLFQLRFSYLEFGLFNGLYLGVSGLMTVAGAVIADRRGRYKEVAGAGYGTSAACKLGLLAARNAPWPASSVLFADRVGKGVRSAPRDALISLSAEPKRLGTAFGVHRAFDTAGAVVGPLVAYFILRTAPTAYDAIFVVSFLFALIGLGILVLFVQNRSAAHTSNLAATWRGALRLLQRKDFRALVIVGSLFGLFTILDAQLYVIFQNRTSFNTSYFPLLPVGMAISYLVLAVPLGHLADRVGRSRVFIAGFLLLLGVYLILLAPSPGRVELIAMLALLGAFYACTDGVLMAMASTTVPRELRTSGIAVLTTAASLSTMTTGIVWGQFSEWWGLQTTVKVYAVAVGAMVIIGAFLLRVRARRYG